jgi:hypothetical protein
MFDFNARLQAVAAGAAFLTTATVLGFMLVGARADLRETKAELARTTTDVITICTTAGSTYGPADGKKLKRDKWSTDCLDKVRQLVASAAASVVEGSEFLAEQNEVNGADRTHAVKHEKRRQKGRRILEKAHESPCCGPEWFHGLSVTAGLRGAESLDGSAAGAADRDLEGQPPGGPPEVLDPAGSVLEGGAGEHRVAGTDGLREIG